MRFMKRLVKKGLAEGKHSRAFAQQKTRSVVTMSETSIGIGTALSMLGIGAFFNSSRKHVTALIPVFLGVPLFLLGLAARKEDLAEKAALGATGVSLAGVLVSVQSLFFPQMFAATAVPRSEYPMRGAIQAMTGVLCASFLGLAIRSLIQEAQDS
jgi:cytochrome bd-type quinol oxidase subunit 2